MKETIQKSIWKFISACFVIEYFYQWKIGNTLKSRTEYLSFAFHERGEKRKGAEIGTKAGGSWEEIIAFCFVLKYLEYKSTRSSWQTYDLWFFHINLKLIQFSSRLVRKNTRAKQGTEIKKTTNRISVGSR